MVKGKAVTWESLAQWQFRFRDNAIASADSAGVSRSTVFQATNELGLTDDLFPMGQGVKVSNEYDKGRLPVGTQVMVGHPDRVTTFGLFVLARGGGWQHLLGEVHNQQGHTVEVLTGDPVEWAVTPGTEAEQEALANFKARAWRVGWKVKLSHRWCESYEGYMAKIGLNEDVLRNVKHGGLTIGERTNPRGSAALPAGSILRWVSRSDPANFTWYIRDDSMNNEARTRAIFGHRRDGSGLRNSGSTMEVMWIANDEGVMALRVDGLSDLIEHLPVGTRFAAGGSQYVLCHDRKVTNYEAHNPTPPTGPWTIEQLGDTVIAGFPS
jgi:hypothetical protein